MNRKWIFYILFFSCAILSAQGNEGAVGIGTDNPKRTLHVEGGMYLRKTEDKTKDEKYDNVLLLGKGETFSSNGQRVDVDGDIYYVPRRIFKNYDAISPDTKGKTLVTPTSNVSWGDVERLTQDAILKFKNFAITINNFRTNGLFFISYASLADIYSEKYTFENEKSLFKKERVQLMRRYKVENNLGIFRTGAQANKDNNLIFLSTTPSYDGDTAWSNMESFLGAKSEDVYMSLKENLLANYVIFDFGIPSSCENAYQGVYRIRMNSYAGRSRLLGNSLTNVGIKDEGQAYLSYVLQQLSLSENKADMRFKNSLWLSGAFTAKNRSWNGFPMGFEIYIHDNVLIPNNEAEWARAWEIARFYEFRVGEGRLFPLFKSFTQFKDLVTRMKDPSNQMGNFLIFYVEDDNGGNTFGGTFPNATHISWGEMMYSLQPNETQYPTWDKLPWQYDENASGNYSLVLYYKGLPVDAIGDGCGKTLTGKIAQPGFQTMGTGINNNFANGQWIKRMPGTRPTENGFYKAKDWFCPKTSSTAHRPLSNSTDKIIANSDAEFPFPIANSSSKQKENGVIWRIHADVDPNTGGEEVKEYPGYLSKPIPPAP